MPENVRKILQGDMYGRLPYSTVLSRIYRGTYYVDFTPRLQLSERDVDFILSRYDAGISYTDMFIGRLLDLLDELSLGENTLIVLHSIHG